MSASSKLDTYLSNKKNSSSPEVSKTFGELEEYYNKKYVLYLCFVFFFSLSYILL